nr:T9SS type A sorting domain-containing protein [Saprospiraceae bacterium]
GTKADFVGVKIGDVNLDSDPSRRASRSAKTLTLYAEDKALQAGARTKMTLDAKALSEFEGFQFTLEVNQQNLKIVNVSLSDESTLRAENLNVSSIENGWMTVSWHNENAIPASVGIVLEVEAQEDVRLSEAMTINSAYTTAEAYRLDGSIANVAVGFESNASAFELMQNTPNPFAEETMIAFRLDEATQATVTVYDVTGKTIKSMEIDGIKGLNSIQFDRPDLVEGVLYYKLQTDKNSAVKKMILLD